jgi:RNA polymerase primary sigma factor
VREPLPLEVSAGDRDGYDVTTFVADTQAPSPFDDAAQRQLKERVASALRQLDPREATVIRMRFGFGPETEKTLAEIGGRLRLSRERVRDCAEEDQSFAALPRPGRVTLTDTDAR